MITFLLRRPLLLALPVAAITLMLALCALNLRVDGGVEALLPSSGSDVTGLRLLHDSFGSDEIVVLALHSDRLFSPEGAAVLEQLTQRAAALPHVGRALSPVNAQDLDGDEMGPFRVVPWEQARAGGRSMQQLGESLAAHPLIGGLLVSRDARTAAVLLELERGGSAEDHRRDLVARARALALAVPAGMRVHVAGLPVEKVDLAASVQRDQMVFAPLILIVVGAALALLYRRGPALVAPLAVILSAMVWTMGLYALAGKRLNPVTGLIMPIIMVTSVEGAVHFLNHYLASRAGGRPRVPALERALGLAWAPCFNAALTTAIGFGSLMLLPIPAIRDFGLFSACGVMIAWGLTMLLMPLLLALPADIGEERVRALPPGRLEHALKSLAGAVARHPAAAALAAGAVLAIGLAGIWRVRVDTDVLGSLRAGSPLVEAAGFIDRHLAGVNGLEILIEGVAPDDPAAMRRLEEFEAALRRLDGVGNVMGLADLCARANRAFHEGDDSQARVPVGATAAADLRDVQDLLAAQAPGELRRFVSEDGRLQRVTARVAAMDTSRSQRLFQEVRDLARRSDLSATLTGDFVALSNMSTTLVYNQVRGLIPALALIVVAMSVQFHSLYLGIISLIPSGAPIILGYGLMGWAGIPLSIATAMIASIAIGMTVDNTIHLMTHFRGEMARSDDAARAMDRMLDASGRAVVYSTITLALGFWVGAFSSFLPSVHFAVLTGTILILGLISQLVLLPLALTLAGRLRLRAAAGSAALACLLCVSQGFTASGVVLKDQFGRSGSTEAHAGRTVLMLYGRPSGLRRMKGWEVAAREKAGADAFEVVRAVDARAVRGKKTEAEVNKRLRESVPPEISILIDWDGALQAAYAIPEEEVTVTLLDPAGRACRTLTGPVSDSGLSQIVDLIARIREKGSCP